MATLTTDGKIDPLPFHVIHPLDDVAEEKCSPEGLGKIKMNRSVKFSLFALRGYLFIMILLVGYRVLTLAGMLGHHLQ